MAGIISQTSIDQVKAASDIVDVIGGMLPLKKSGANFQALCPFHKEKTPSFNVSPHKQMFYCYGCHKGGDVFAFVTAYENVDFPQAVERLAERARITLLYEGGRGSSEKQQEHRHVKELLLEVHEQITQRWQSALKTEAGGEIARAYISRRQVPAEAVSTFRLGYAPEAWDDTVNWAKSKGYDLKAVEQAGLILSRESGGYYDRFRGRLIFPICDEQGRVIGFSGRILTDEKAAKYVNSPETPIFSKGRVIYGLDKAKRAMLDAQFALVCEGQLDCIACHMAGITNAVAPQGTAFTSEHARILKRYVNEVVLCFDSDNAGQNATVRVLEDLLDSGLAIRVARLPSPHDPDSFTKAHGAEAFQALIKSAEGFFDYYLNSLCESNDINTDKGQQTVVRAMAAGLHKTKDNFLIDKYARKTAARMGVNPLNATKQFQALASKSSRPAQRNPDEPEAPVEETFARPSAEELWLLKLALLDDESLDWLEAYLQWEWIVHPAVKEILERRLSRKPEGQRRDAAELLPELSSDDVRQLVAELCMEKRVIPRKTEQVKDTALRLRNQHLDREMARLTQQSARPNVTPEEQVEIFREQNRLRELKRTRFQ